MQLECALRGSGSTNQCAHARTRGGEGQHSDSTIRSFQAAAANAWSRTTHRDQYRAVRASGEWEG